MPVGSLSLSNSSSVRISLFAAFSSKPSYEDELTFTFEKVYYAGIKDSARVWLTPASPAKKGISIRIVDSTTDGGSIGISRGTALQVGTPRFVSSGYAPLNLGYFLTGPVECIRIDKLQYTWMGDISLTGDSVNYVRLSVDDGDGRYDSGTDYLLSGRLEFNEELHTISFYPDSLLLYPATDSYILLEVHFADNIPKGSSIRVDLDSSGCKAAGVFFNSSGGVVERTQGTPPKLYGSKVQGATLFFGTPDSGGGGDSGGDSGDPYANQGSGGGGGGCFIATACFGSLSNSYVRSLCEMRDKSVLRSETGSSVVCLYYSVSPYVATRFEKQAGMFLRMFFKRVSFAYGK